MVMDNLVAMAMLMALATVMVIAKAMAMAMDCHHCPHAQHPRRERIGSARSE